MPTHAIHVVTTTYGSWLPGDSRGHWSPLFDLYGTLIRKGHQLNLPDKPTFAIATASLAEPPKILSAHERAFLANDLAAHFAHASLSPEQCRYTVPANALPGKGNVYTKPRCHAAAIEDTHIHLLLSAVDEDLDRYVGRLKSTTASALKTLAPNQTRTHLWTAKFWRVFLYDSDALHTVATYIAAHNLRRHLPAHPHPWLTPI